MKKPNSNKKTAIIVGVLFIIATAFLFIGESFYKPVLGSVDYLSIAYPQRVKAVTGILIEFICVISIPLIAIFLYPILRKHNEALAIGYVGFRLLEAILFIGDETKHLSLITISQNYLNASGEEAKYFQVVGSSIQSEITWTFSIYVIVFALGALMLYSILYQSKLVPRWLSGWGFLAAILILTGATLDLFELEFISSESIFEIVFAAPIAVQEMVLAGWLIIKGFNSS